MGGTIALPEWLTKRWGGEPKMLHLWEKMSDKHRTMLLELYTAADAGALTSGEVSEMVQYILLSHMQEFYHLNGK